MLRCGVTSYQLHVIHEGRLRRYKLFQLASKRPVGSFLTFPVTRQGTAVVRVAYHAGSIAVCQPAAIIRDTPTGPVMEC